MQTEYKYDVGEECGAGLDMQTGYEGEQGVLEECGAGLDNK